MIGNFGGHRVNGIHRYTHRKRMRMAIKDRAALRCNLDCSLLLSLCPAYQLEILDHLKVIESSDQADRPNSERTA